MLKAGDEAPDFELPDQTGKPVRLASFRGRRVVLYFYPADHTMGCTLETKRFARKLPDFEQRDAVVLGISSQSVESKAQFAADCGVPDAPGMRLLVDRRRETMKKYGVLSSRNVAHRVTFIIDREGRIAHAFASELLWTRHVSQALAGLVE